jgi:hypothetical protein
MDMFMRTEFGNNDKFMGAELEARGSSFKMVPGSASRVGGARDAQLVHFGAPDRI